MTLHEAIEQVLTENGKTMTYAEIAKAIAEKDLYRRKKDGLHVEAWQIKLRVMNYPTLFRNDNDKVSLNK